jgi:hypothetical protein
MSSTRGSRRATDGGRVLVAGVLDVVLETMYGQGWAGARRLPLPVSAIMKFPRLEGSAIR